MLIDAHCHILFGVDDASKTAEETLNMLKIADEDGLDYILATSHIHYKFPENNRKLFEENLAKCNALIHDAGMNVKLIKGCEFYLDKTRTDMLTDEWVTPLGNSNVLLIEMPWVHQEGVDETDLLQKVIDAGYIPMVAHPERYSCVHENETLIDQWMAMGCLMQVNRTSLLGFDKIHLANIMAEKMLMKNQIFCIGSDAHRYTWPRIPVLSDVHDYICKVKDKETADALCGNNIAKLLKL